MGQTEQKKRRIYFCFWIGAAVLWTTFIWSNSLRAGIDSSNQSAKVMLLLKPILNFLGIPEELHHFLVRKAAHFTEFAVLSVLWWKVFLPMQGKLCQRPVTALLITVATAAADETLQRFSEGRACSLRDVWIDSMGGLCAVLLCVLLHMVWERRHRTES